MLIDSTNYSTYINLKSDGSLSGFSNYNNYYVFTDYNGEPEQIIDKMALYFNEEKSKSFAFKIKSDTTYLYSTTGDEGSGELLQIDKIQYKLVRK